MALGGSLTLEVKKRKQMKDKIQEHRLSGSEEFPDDWETIP